MDKLHPGFLWRSISLPLIAAATATNQILPNISAAARLWYDVLQLQTASLLPRDVAVHAAVSVSREDVLAANFLHPERNMLLDENANDARQEYTGIDHSAGWHNYHSLALGYELQCLSCRTNAIRLIARV